MSWILWGFLCVIFIGIMYRNHLIESRNKKGFKEVREDLDRINKKMVVKND